MIKKPKFIKNNEKSLGVLSSSPRSDFPDDSIYQILRMVEVSKSFGVKD
jgi:hypothetical protein